MASPTSPPIGRRRGTSLSSVAHEIVSVTENVLNSDVPTGFYAATAEVVPKAPLAEFRRGSASEQSSSPIERSRRTNSWRIPPRRAISELSEDVPSSQTKHDALGTTVFPALTEEVSHTGSDDNTRVGETANLRSEQTNSSSDPTPHQPEIKPLNPGQKIYTSGYIPPPTLPWTISTRIALQSFSRWVLTPFGFLITLYALNIVAWGGMLFLLLCNASPAMCYPTCNDINSPRRKWIEIDSQILNALFCVTGFGLIPWRFRDAYYIIHYRLFSRNGTAWGLQKLAGHYRTWFRLPPSLETIPESKAPSEPLTGVRAPPTPIYKLEIFIYCQILNTCFQAALCGFMWGLNRFDRPSWSTGLFIALACGIAAIGGIVSYIEGRRVKRVEGSLPSPAVQAELTKRSQNDEEHGLRQIKTTGQESTLTGHESVHLADKSKQHV